MWASSMVCNMQLNVYIDETEDTYSTTDAPPFVWWIPNFSSLYSNIHTHTLHAQIHISLIYIFLICMYNYIMYRDTAFLSYQKIHQLDHSLSCDHSQQPCRSSFLVNWFDLSVYQRYLIGQRHKKTEQNTTQTNKYTYKTHSKLAMYVHT